MKGENQIFSNTQPSVNIPQDVHDIIIAYIAGKGAAHSEVMQKLNISIHRQRKPHKFTVMALKAPRGTILLEAMFMDIVRGWPSREKNKAAKALLKFAVYLRTAHGISLDESMLPRDIKDMTERRLDMLKYLQVPRTMTDLENNYLTSARTLRSDLAALEDGWEVLGSRIVINRINTDRTITYNSTVHPVLLPLNLTEVYALIAGLPKLAKGTVYEEIVQYFASAVGIQLSGYAANIIAKSAPDTCLGRMTEEGLNNRDERQMLDQNRYSWLIYLAKQGRRCRLAYANEAGEVLHTEGIPSLRHGDLRYIGFLYTEELIPLSAIISFEPLEPYQ